MALPCSILVKIRRGNHDNTGHIFMSVDLHRQGYSPRHHNDVGVCGVHGYHRNFPYKFAVSVTRVGNIRGVGNLCVD